MCRLGWCQVYLHSICGWSSFVYWREANLDPILFPSLVGDLQYLTIISIDLSCIVNSICQFMHVPTKDHFCIMLKAWFTIDFNYIVTPLLHCLAIQMRIGQAALGLLQAIIFFGTNLISWCSRKQVTMWHLVTRQNIEP